MQNQNLVPQIYKTTKENILLSSSSRLVSCMWLFYYCRIEIVTWQVWTSLSITIFKWIPSSTCVVVKLFFDFFFQRRTSKYTITQTTLRQYLIPMSSKFRFSLQLQFVQFSLQLCFEFSMQHMVWNTSIRPYFLNCLAMN